jgi:hypothetical protein
MGASQSKVNPRNQRTYINPPGFYPLKKQSSTEYGLNILGLIVAFALFGILVSLGICSLVTISDEITYLNNGDQNNCVKSILQNMDPVVLQLSIAFVVIFFIVCILFIILFSYKSYKIANQ